MIRTTKGQSGSRTGMGFGISPTIFDDSAGLSNAEEGLRVITYNDRVKAATIISPHAYGKEITGDFFKL